MSINNLVFRTYKLALKFEKYFKYIVKNKIGIISDRSSDSQVIICGIPRSGTSLFFNMLNSTLVDYDCYYGFKFKNTKSREASALNIITRKGSFITKKPDDLFNLTDIVKYNVRKKKLIVFIMIRDFRNIITSKHQWGDGEYYLDIDKKNTIDGQALNNRGLVHYLMEIEKFRLDINGYVNNTDVVEIIKYEDLINNPKHIIDILEKNKIDNKGLEALINYDSVYKEDEKSSKGVKRLSTRWKKDIYDKRISTQFSDKLIREFLIRYGYEENHKWYDEYIKN